MTTAIKAAIAPAALTAALAAATLFAAIAPVRAETLFKIITVKDEIVVGVNERELRHMGGDAGGIAKAIAANGSLSLWQYAVTRDKDGSQVMAPRAKIGVMAASSLRVEPYKQPYKILPHQ